MSTRGLRRWTAQACSGPGVALTVAELRAQWAELADSSPILVIRDVADAHWAQHADVLMADSGLLVARLFAPYAKQSQPPPGTVWSSALTSGATPSRPRVTGIETR